MNPGDFDLLQAFTDGHLSQSEEAALHERLQKEPALQEQLVALQEMIAVLKAKEKAKLKKELAATWANTKKQNKGRIINRPFIFRAVAAVFVLILLSWFMFRTPTQAELSVRELVTLELQQPYPSPTQVRDINPAIKPSPVFIEAYQNGNYQAAIDFLQSDTTSVARLSWFNFYLGLCHLYLQPPQVREAIAALQQAAGEQNLYTNSANWYLALAFLLNEETEKAKEILENYEGRESWKKEEVNKLLEKLDTD